MSYPQNRASVKNSTNTPLEAGGVFTGDWDINSENGAAVRILTDQPGTVTVEFGVPVPKSVDPSGYYTLFSRPVQVYANASLSQFFSKGAEVACRVTYTNGDQAQSTFVMQTTYGDNPLPVSASAENEVYTTVTEREQDVTVAYRVDDITATAYHLLIDLDNAGGQWPHALTGHIEITNTFLQADKSSNAQGSIGIGVITRIDGTDADVTFVQGISFTNQSDRQIVRDRKYSPSQLKFEIDDEGNLNKILANVTETTTSVNTGTTLPSPAGVNITPAVGDVIVRFAHTAGTFTALTSVTYHGDRG